MRALLLIAMLAACGDNKAAREDAGLGDAGVDAPDQALKHCLDERAALVRPPNGQLPCDLLPPGFLAGRGLGPPSPSATLPLRGRAGSAPLPEIRQGVGQ